MMAISSGEIERIARASLVPHLPWPPERVKSLELSSTLNGDLLLPRGTLSHEIGGLGDVSRAGSFSFYLLFKVDGEVRKQVWIRGRVKAVSSVVVARTSLGRNQVIAEGDVALEEREAGEVESDALLDVAEAVGKRVSRSVRVNEVLRSRFLEQPPLVKRGDLVAIVAESATLKISAQGKALESGAKGEVIRVLNPSSKKEILGRVEGPATVHIDF